MKGSYSLLFFLSACGVQLEDGKNNEDTSVTADTADSADTNENLSDCLRLRNKFRQKFY